MNAENTLCIVETAVRTAAPGLELAPNKSTGELAAGLRAIMDGLEMLEAVEKDIKAKREQLKGIILSRMRSEGLEKLSAGRLSFTKGEKVTVSMDPDKWESITKGLIERGLGFCLYRQLSAAKVQEAFIDGANLPDGITLGSMDTLNIRRTK